MNWPLLNQSLVISASVALLAGLIGSVVALWLASAGARIRLLLLAASGVILAIPPFVVTNAWLDVASFGGTREWVPFSLFSNTAAVLVMAALYWPIPALAMWAAWSRIEPELIESEPCLRGAAFVRHLLAPLGRGAFVFSFALVFILALNNFSVASVLQARTYPVHVWIALNSGLSAGRALVASWPLIVIPLLLFLILVRKSVAWPFRRQSAVSEIFRTRLGQGWFWSGVAVTTLALGVSLCFPLIELGCSKSAWVALPAVIKASGQAAWNSLATASAASIVCGAAGLLLAARGMKWLWPRFLWVLFLVPGTVLGIWLASILGWPALSPIRDSLFAVVMALALRLLALSWGIARTAIDGSDRELADVARLDGANLAQRIRHVYWPQVGPQLLAGLYIVYLLCLWEVETVLPVVPPGGDTLAMRIFNLLHYGHTPEVNALCLVLLGLALLPLAGFLLVKSSWRSGLSALIAAALLFAGCSAEEGGPTPGTLHSKLFERLQVIGSKGAGLGQFTKPRSLAVDAQDNLYVADMTGRIQKFSPEGTFLLSWQMPQTDLGRPKGMCRDSEGNVVVIEPHYSRINHFDPQGRLKFQWGRHGTNSGELAFPRAATPDGKGGIYVSEYGLFERVQRFDLLSEGSNRVARLAKTIGSAGTQPGQFNRPEGLGIDSDGNLFVADSCNHRVQVFHPSGALLAAFGKPGVGPGQLSYPYDVAVDKKGFRFVCEFGNSRIQVFDQHNAPVEVIGKAGFLPGQFNNPWAVALDSVGNLYVADAMNHRVQKLVRAK